MTTTTNASTNLPANEPLPGSALVVGGTGKTGRRVTERLTALGIDTRPVSRSAEVRFDWHDPTTWPAALDGVEVAYLTYHPDLAFPGAAEAIASLGAAAVERGVQRLVLLSGRGEPAAQAAEQALLAVAPWATVVSAAWFMQNFSEHFLLDPVREGVIALPAGEVAEPFVDVEDIADVAVAALIGDDHAGRVHGAPRPDVRRGGERDRRRDRSERAVRPGQRGGVRGGRGAGRRAGRGGRAADRAVRRGARRAQRARHRRCAPGTGSSRP